MPEYPEVCREAQPKAKKLHRCCECAGKILPGEKYHLCQGLWDGQWDVFKTCAECESLRNEVRESIEWEDDHPAFGDLYQDIFEGRERLEWVKAYMDTRRKRNAPRSIGGWMEEAEAEMLAIHPRTKPQRHEG